MRRSSLSCALAIETFCVALILAFYFAVSFRPSSPFTRYSSVVVAECGWRHL